MKINVCLIIKIKKMKIENIPGLSPHQILLLKNKFGNQIFGKNRIKLVSRICSAYNVGYATATVYPIRRVYKKDAKRMSFTYVDNSRLAVDIVMCLGFLFKVEFNKSRRDLSIITIAF